MTVYTAHGSVITDSLFGGRKATMLGLNAAMRALDQAQSELPAIRELRRLTGDPVADWCRGEDAYCARRKRALERIARCRRAIADAEARLTKMEG